MLRRYLLLLGFSLPLLAQPVASIEISGNVKPPRTLSAEDLLKMPRATLRLPGGGNELVYEGVWLHEVLKAAGVAQGERLRGKALTTYVLAEAKDGYQVLFSLAELDPSYVDNQVLLADKLDGKPLDEDQGPFRLVVPKDKPGARGIRMLVKLQVVQVRQ